jgi:hypothetical protein
MPPEREGPGVSLDARPNQNFSSYHTTDKEEGSAYCIGLRRRRAASRRHEVLDSGRSDPWWYSPPGERGYPQPAAHLAEHGLVAAPNLPALRAMYKSGGDDRQVAEAIARHWRLVA